jgi:hypothetical protein
MTSSKSLANALLQSDSVIEGLKTELSQEEQIHDELIKELTIDIENILLAELPLSYTDFHLKIRNGKFEITNLKIPTDNTMFEDIKDLLGVNSYKIYLKSAPSKIEFYNEGTL